MATNTGMMIFKIGDRVTHPSLGEGVVSSTDAIDVRVTFARVGKKPVVGIYDPNWFATHAGWLRHIPKTSEPRND